MNILKIGFLIMILTLVSQEAQALKIPSTPVLVYRKSLPPMGKVDPRIDPVLTQAAGIAEKRAASKSRSQCWHYVKEALLVSKAVVARPITAEAKEAGEELVRHFGFVKSNIRDPYKAPVGAVVVYSTGPKKPGHVEIRTKHGFVSDFKGELAFLENPLFHPTLKGVYVKMRKLL